MPLGNFAAQLTHASRKSAWLASERPPENTHAVVLGVPDEQALLAVAARLAAAGLSFVLVREPDPPFNGAATAIGVCPGPRSPVRKLLSGLPLVR